MQQRQHRQENIVQVTAEQKAKWTNHTAVYADIVIHKDKGDWASQQVVAAVLRHGKYPAGKSCQYL